MSWLLNLYRTYEANSGQVGVIEFKHNGQEYTLLPVSHTTQNAQVEVIIDGDGKLLKTKVLSKDESSTLIPCTENSASRAGSVVSPYPLHDKLIYVAGDYNNFTADKKQTTHFQEYIQQLREWAESPYATENVKIIYHYVSKGSLIRDLVDRRVLAVDENSQLISKWHDKYTNLYSCKPDIFSAVTGDQESVFVRFTVVKAGEVAVPVWKDTEMYTSFIRFYEQKLGNVDFCYVTGEKKPSTERHANKIRNAGDKAKLISSNDTSGFTFRGRFNESNDAASISYDVSQKAHNALKWLINRQAKKTIDNRVFLVWGNKKTDVPDIAEDSFSMMWGDFLADDLSLQVSDPLASTDISTAEHFNKALKGYRHNLLTELGEARLRINILILDSATTGRMAVLYYREIDAEEYFQRIEDWHSKCTWLHRYHKNKAGKYVSFYGAPSTRDIAFAAYGSHANEKVIKGLMERMLPCMIDNRKLPLDIERRAIQRASSPQSMENWEWEKTLTITCALIKSVTEGYDVALDHNQNDRDYLFGRMLALADILERRVLQTQNEKRATNAIRYMNSFARYPERTWKTIQASLQPYQARLGVKATDITKTIDEVASRISFEKFNNDPLSGKYLLGFYSQRNEWYQRSKQEEDKQDELEEMTE